MGIFAVTGAMTSVAICAVQDRDAEQSRYWVQKPVSDGKELRWYQDSEDLPARFTYFDTMQDSHPFAAFSPMVAGSEKVHFWNAVQDGNARSESVEIRVNNDDITVKVNGEEIPQNRIKREDGRIIILDEGGNELRDFNLFINNGENPFANVQMPEWRNMIEEGLVRDQFGQPLNVSADPPGAMIGIHMEAPGAALRKHLRLGEDEGVLVTGVLTGLPAHNAGIGEFDVVLAIDGNNVSSTEDLRTAIAEREPGDVVELEVIQSGRRRAIEVKLVEYDAERVANADVIGSVPTTAQDLWLTQQGNVPFGVQNGGQGRWLFAPDGENIMRFQFPRDLQFDRDLNAWREVVPDRFFNGDGLRDFRFGDVDDEAVTDERRQESEDHLERLDRRIAELEKLLDRLIDEANRRGDG